MSNETLSAMLAALDKRADDADLPRMPRNPRSTANSNHPFKAEGYRAPRARSWRDPVGQAAAGNVDSQRKKEKNR